MSYPLDNLGDYNKVRIDLQNANGSMEKLYKQIGDTAIAKKAPYLLLAGAGLLFAGQKAVAFIRSLKKKIEDEPELKERFKQEIEAIQSETQGQIVEDKNDVEEGV